jgi:hypothetical protein
MANTTFSGPVRSENNVQLISKTASTGVVHNRTQGFGLMDARRKYLYEPFLQRPGLNAINIIDPDANDATALAVTQAANKNFETLGTNYTTALTTFSATQAGIVMTTATTDQDQAILLPHLDTNQTAWSGTKWGTENQVEWECSISLPALDNQKVWAGLKLTNDQLPQTDANQAYFYYATDATNGQALSDYSPWYFIYSVGGTDYLTNTGITVAADTMYHFKIAIDSDRKASIFVNGVQYSVTQTAATTFDGSTEVTGTTQATIAESYSATNANTQKSVALTDDIDLIPYIGIECGAGAAEVLNVHYTAISRHVFE